MERKRVYLYQPFFVFALLLSVFQSQAIYSKPGFADEQFKFPRVREARKSTQSTRDSLLSLANLNGAIPSLFIRILKHERILELWGADMPGEAMSLIVRYPFTEYSGKLGPKRAEGDFQIPEGVYYIDRFNPRSKFHLSLGLNYPNKSDRLRKNGSDPGCDIFIHGSDVTIGCIPIGDDAISELYMFAIDAKAAGQESIPVHIFPCNMTKPPSEEILGSASRSDERQVSFWGRVSLIFRTIEDDTIAPNIRQKTLISFWDELTPIYEQFETYKVIPNVRITEAGQYYIID